MIENYLKCSLVLSGFFALSAPDNCKAQQLPSLKQGMAYGAAREALVKAGWQASINNPLHQDDLQKTLQKWFIRQGFYEIVSCMPTGLGLCTAVFNNAQGRKLYVETSEPQPSPKLAGWCFKKTGCSN